MQVHVCVENDLSVLLFHTGHHAFCITYDHVSNGTTCFGLAAVAMTCSDIGHTAVGHGRWRLIYGMPNLYETLMMLICDPGYYYRGQRVIRCQANGTWDYPEPNPACESE